MRRGTTFDLKKCLAEGKPLVIEGSYILDSLYLEKSA